jgi:hypothetical protein
LYGDTIFLVISGGGEINEKTAQIVEGGYFLVVQNILKEFTFPYTNVLISINDVVDAWSLHLLQLPKSISNLLPLGALGVGNFETLSDINTHKYNSEGEIPIDVISFGYYTVGPIGSILTVLLYSLIFSRIDSFFLSYNSYIMSSVHSLVACKLCFVVMYADLDQILTGDIHIIVFFIITFFVKEVRLKTNSQ